VEETYQRQYAHPSHASKVFTNYQTCWPEERFAVASELSYASLAFSDRFGLLVMLFSTLALEPRYFSSNDMGSLPGCLSVRLLFLPEHFRRWLPSAPAGVICDTCSAD